MNKRGSLSLSRGKIQKPSPRHSKISLQPIPAKDPSENFEEIFLGGNNVYSLQKHKCQENKIINPLQNSPKNKISSPKHTVKTVKKEREPKIRRKTNIERILPANPSQEPVPPYIRRLERFMTKLETLSKRPSIKCQSTDIESKYLSPKYTKSVKDKPSGMPARFKEVFAKKNYTSQKSLHKDVLRIKKDLNIIKITDGLDLKERLEIAKLLRKFEITNGKDSILKNRVLDESWRWYTPGNTPVNKSVHFDAN